MGVARRYNRYRLHWVNEMTTQRAAKDVQEAGSEGGQGKRGNAAGGAVPVSLASPKFICMV